MAQTPGIDGLQEMIGLVSRLIGIHEFQSGLLNSPMSDASGLFF